MCINTMYLYIVVPSSGFTQRATLDPELNEIHVLTVSDICVIVQLIVLFSCV